MTSIELQKDGFEIMLTEPAKAESLQGLTLASHRYHYHAKYGSPKVDEQKMDCEASLSSDGKTITLKSDLRPSHLHTIGLQSIRSTEDKSLLGNVAYYHLVKER